MRSRPGTKNDQNVLPPIHFGYILGMGSKTPKELSRSHFRYILGMVLKKLNMSLLGQFLAAFWAWCQKGSKWLTQAEEIEAVL